MQLSTSPLFAVALLASVYALPLDTSSAYQQWLDGNPNSMQGAVSEGMPSGASQTDQSFSEFNGNPEHAKPLQLPTPLLTPDSESQIKSAARPHQFPPSAKEMSQIWDTMRDLNPSVPEKELKPRLIWLLSHKPALLQRTTAEMNAELQKLISRGPDPAFSPV